MLKNEPLHRRRNISLAIVAVAFMYALTAYLGLFLAVPPGYATAIWIPSGIALGAAIVWGLPILPGIFLGSFITNYYTSLSVDTNLSLLTPLLTGIIISTGACLQTAVGYYLIKETVGLRNPLNEPRTILLFGLLSGPVSCLVNATWSNLFLLHFNIVNQKILLLSWTTWWIGDSMGVLIFTPLFLILFSQPRAVWFPRINTIFLPLCVSFLAVIIIYLVTYKQELQWAVLLCGLFFCVLINVILFIINGQQCIDENLRFQKILELTPEAILMYDAHGNILFSNKTAEKLFGYTKKEFLGQSINQLIPQLESRKTKTLFGCSKSGLEFPIEKTLSPVEVPEGIVTLAVIRDITERVKLDQLKVDFISVVSHELRTPLTSIQGVLSLLTAGMSEYELNQKSARLLLLAKKNCARLIRLINDILDIDKIESGKNLFHFTEFRIQDLIDETVKIYQPYANNHNIPMELDTCKEDLIVQGDRDRLIQVLTNLLSNAIKFSPPGTPVTIACKKINNSVRVSVTDLGQGITEEFKSKIFQKFAQEDASSVRKHGGSGLGLSISKSIIERHHGVIDYACNNPGTTFYFELPLLPQMIPVATE